MTRIVDARWADHLDIQILASESFALWRCRYTFKTRLNDLRDNVLNAFRASYNS